MSDMSEFDELLDDNANWQEDDGYDECPVCAGDGGWWEDDNGNWPESSDYKGDQVWIKCESCGGNG